MHTPKVYDPSTGHAWEMGLFEQTSEILGTAGIQPVLLLSDTLEGLAWVDQHTVLTMVLHRSSYLEADSHVVAEENPGAN